MIILSKEHILMLHSQLISKTGCIDGILENTLLESASHIPFQSFTIKMSIHLFDKK